MYDNHTPFWAIKRNMLVRQASVLTSIEPSIDKRGSDKGEFHPGGGAGMAVQDISKIVFAGPGGRADETGDQRHADDRRQSLGGSVRRSALNSRFAFATTTRFPSR